MHVHWNTYETELGDCELNCIGFIAIATMHDWIPPAGCLK